MPKGRRVAGAKKKKLDKQKKMRTQDFVKARRKLGKKLEKHHATEINFKSQRVRVASQEVETRKEALNKLAQIGNDGMVERDMSKEEIRKRVSGAVTVISNEMAHLSSHKWKSRQSVIDNIRKVLRDACEQTNADCTAQVTRVAMVQCVRLFEVLFDPSLAVRTSLRNFLSYLLSTVFGRRCSVAYQCSANELIARWMGPFGETMVTHLNAALSHSDASIRADSLHILFILGVNSPKLVSQFGEESLQRLLSNLSSMLSDELENSSKVETRLLECITQVCRALRSIQRDDAFEMRELTAVHSSLLAPSSVTSSLVWSDDSAIGTHGRFTLESLISLFHDCSVLLREYCVKMNQDPRQQNNESDEEYDDDDEIEHKINVDVEMEDDSSSKKKKNSEVNMMHNMTLLLSILDLTSHSLSKHSPRWLFSQCSNASRMFAAVKLLCLKVTPKLHSRTSQLKSVSVCLRLMSDEQIAKMFPDVRQCLHEWIALLMSVLSNSVLKDREWKNTSMLSQTLRCLSQMMRSHRSMISQQQSESMFRCVFECLTAPHVLKTLSSQSSIIPPSMLDDPALTFDAVLDRFLLQV